MKKLLGLAAATAAAALALTACSSGSGDAGTSASPSAPASSADNSSRTITLWLAGGDTPDELRTYLKDTFKAKTGATLAIEEQSWGDLLTKLTTALPDAENTPDVVELGNTQAPTFTNVGAFADVSDMYEELGGAKLLQSFVEAGSVDGKQYALPYYFGSRYMFVRKDVWKEAGVATPTTLDEFNSAVATIAAKNPRDIKNFSGFFIGGQDWRNGISWIFANGGDLAKKVDGQWQSTLADPNSLKGLAQLQTIYKTASKAPARRQGPVAVALHQRHGRHHRRERRGDRQDLARGRHDHGPGLGALVDRRPQEGRRQGHPRSGTRRSSARWCCRATTASPPRSSPAARTSASRRRARTRTSPASCMRIIFSAEYQQKLGGAGLGPANSDYVSSLGDDEFAQALIASASNSKLTPAAPGWAAVESAQLMEEFFGKVRDAV